VDDLCVSPFMRSLSAERYACFLRILIAISPRMYREVLALSIHRRRTDLEVLLAPPGSLDGRAERFGPHVLLQDAEETGLPVGASERVVCRVRILKKTERIDATIDLDGAISELHDVCLDELFAALEEAEMLSAVVARGRWRVGTSPTVSLRVRPSPR
jgi:hypothetical protein